LWSTDGLYKSLTLHVDCDWEYEYKVDFYSDSPSLVGKSNYLKMIEERVNKKRRFYKKIY
jgi:hypothetical protein